MPNEQSGNSFILLYRSLQEHWLFRERRRFSRLEAWIDLLMLAAHADHEVILKGELYNVRRGDVLWSQRELARRWQWSDKKLRGYLEVLEKDSMIRTQRLPRRVTQITICNYNAYQKSGRRKYSSGARKEDAAVTQQYRRTKNGYEWKRNIPMATQLYDHYTSIVVGGNREDSIRSIAQLLTNFSFDQLKCCVDRYAGNGMSSDKQYRIRPHNFWGKAERYKEYLPDVQQSTQTGDSMIPVNRCGPTETQRILAEVKQ